MVANITCLGKPPLDSPMESKDQPNSKNARTWTWWPTWHELTTHYIKEVGFLACSAQMFGATIFWISGFTAIPGIYDRLTTTAAQNGAYWAPQVIGGSGFIVSGTLFMLETQQKWYLPAWTVLGWHIGVWNLIGVCEPSNVTSSSNANYNATGHRLHALRSSWLCGLKQRCRL